MRVRRIILVVLLCCGCKRQPSGLNASLYKAVEKGDRARICTLIAQGADVNAKSSSGSTVLHLAARAGHVRMAELLLSYGADADASDRSDGTPLHCAVKEGHAGLVRCLVAHGANVNSRTLLGGATPLQTAFRYHHKEMVELLLVAGADPDIGDNRGDTVLHVAAAGGDLESIALFLSHGAHVNVKSREGTTPLHETAWENQVEAARLLLARGAEVNAVDKCGETPLHVAAVNGHKELFDLLVAGGADIHARNIEGRTPLDCMRPPDAPGIVRLSMEGRNPYSVIITSPTVVRGYLRFRSVEFDRVWIPERGDLENLDLRAAIEKSAHIDTESGFDLDFILSHLEQYNREHGGYIRAGRKYILCNMDLGDSETEPYENHFTWGSDGGPISTRIFIDMESGTVIRMDCNNY